MKKLFPFQIVLWSQVMLLCVCCRTQAQSKPLPCSELLISEDTSDLRWGSFEAGVRQIMRTKTRLALDPRQTTSTRKRIMEDIKDVALECSKAYRSHKRGESFIEQGIDSLEDLVETVGSRQLALDNVLLYRNDASGKGEEYHWLNDPARNEVLAAAVHYWMDLIEYYAGTTALSRKDFVERNLRVVGLIISRTPLATDPEICDIFRQQIITRLDTVSLAGITNQDHIKQITEQSKVTAKEIAKLLDEN